MKKTALVIASFAGIVLVGAVSATITIARGDDKDNSCEGLVAFSDIIDCAGTERKKEILQLYRDSIERHLEVATGGDCITNFLDVYAKLFEDIEMSKFPELYFDFIEAALERGITKSDAKPVFAAMDTLDEISQSIESARLGLVVGNYYEDQALITKYQDLLIERLREMNYQNIVTQDCKMWLGPSARDVMSDADFRTRLIAASGLDTLTLYDDDLPEIVYPALYTECQSRGPNLITNLSLPELGAKFSDLSFYAGTPKNPHPLYLEINLTDFMKLAKKTKTKDGVTYQKNLKLSFCYNETSCEIKNLTLKIQILETPTYYGASAVETNLSQKKVEISPTDVYIAKQLNPVEARVGQEIKISFYHNFYAEKQRLNVPWQIEKDFSYNTYAVTVHDRKLEVPEYTGTIKYLAELNLDEDLYYQYLDYVREANSFPETYSGSNHLLTSKNNLYAATLEDYLVKDNYTVSFRMPGEYQLCERIVSLGSTEQPLTKVCAVFYVKEDKIFAN